MESKRSMKMRPMKPRRKLRKAIPVTRSILDHKISLRDAGDLAVRAFSAAAALVNPEHKLCVLANAAVPATNTGSITYLSPLAEGSDWNARDGRSVRLISRYFSCVFRWNTAATTPIVVRLMVFRDLACQGAAPAVSDVLAFTGSALAVVAPINPVNERRFQVLHDVHANLDPYSHGTQIAVLGEPDNAHLLYLDTGATITGAGIGALFLLIIADTTVANTPSVDYYSQMRFIDN
jgi:hypothetical protein